MQIPVVVFFTISWCVVVIHGECKFNINGVQGTGLYKRGYCHYLGVPYAKPISADWRELQVAEGANLEELSIKFWNFTQWPSNCTQYDFEEHQIGGSDDCLYLNIYTQPWIEVQKPVLVWIHGGTFNFGSGSTDHADYPDAFVANNVTVVSLNYRLGALGFLYSNTDKGITENVGLRDQQEALRWIQRNIGHFGGNPSMVTLMGWSAGSAAVSYHLYDPSNDGLFHGAIMMSGSFLNPWAYAPSPRDCLTKLCLHFGISCNFRGNLRETLSAVGISRNVPFWITTSFFGIHYPCFVPMGKIPQALVKVKPPIDVPLMIGYTSQETLKHIDLNYMGSASINYAFPNEQRLQDIADLLEFTLPEVNRTDVLVVGDLIYGVIKFAEEYSMRTKSNTFLYKFSMSNAQYHGDDLPFIFREISGSNTKVFSKEDETLGSQMVQLWSNFIKFRSELLENE